MNNMGNYIMWCVTLLHCCVIIDYIEMEFIITYRDKYRGILLLLEG